MPHKEENQISIVELHPTFAAEVHGVDFSGDVSDEQFDEVYKAITKVSGQSYPQHLHEALSRLL